MKLERRETLERTEGRNKTFKINEKFSNSNCATDMYFPQVQKHQRLKSSLKVPKIPCEAPIYCFFQEYLFDGTC
jgi:hypothetical protein